ncbi:hypothetical protein PC9H_010481 [Pleurotus ostreatus]|uniref:Carbonic anhydrase n=3 Tax=Pleurotus TaxID=5320 RepID=A0A8H7DPS3_PLEOS|nr:uncharacterized protein PC9H_010481 [Pleurotus ostreatus]KAF7422325.1 hypothetical protein PC9H_010481 [Pleurotus ostreatus]KAG9227781.1 hypothetical protein CCMSSC00406_0000573 [Pleurotus cornucopiae]KAJ8691854.1 hypothetical protein PTI98_011379 [Pleurotus ostreatus]
MFAPSLGLSCFLLCALFVLPGQSHVLFQDGGKGANKLAAPKTVKGLLNSEKKFGQHLEKANPGFLQQSAASQNPTFMLLGCSDSRVSEGTIFHTQPGIMFAGRNVAAQYYDDDTNGNAVLTYATHHLGVQHIIVMGHYGCGGVAAAITSPMTSEKDAKDSIDHWVWPIRDTYLKSTRSEVVELRDKNKKLKTVPAPTMDDPGYHALVEENVKENVKRVHASKVAKSYSGKKITIHGWVYDLLTAEIRDLNVTVSFGN